MGKRYLRTIVSDFQTLTASADITPVDLPVNPISFLILTLQGTGVTFDVTGQYSLISDFLSGITNVEVQRHGENIVQGQLTDIAMVNAVLHGYFPWGAKVDGDVGRVRTMSFVIAFSRKPYWHEEALPATQRGQLRFRMTAGALPTAFSARSWALESIELIEDVPTRHLKYTTLTRALTATGRQRMQLPSANDLLGVLLFDPTTVVQDASDFAFQRVKILKQNVEQYFQESNWESLLSYAGLRGALTLQLGGHTHEITAAQMNQTSAANAAARTEEPEFEKNEVPNQYAYLDFDPLDDGSYAIEGEPGSVLELDLNPDVSTGTVRVLPIELVKIGGGAAGA